ncbi:hypothetical protein L3Q72_06620 [Vibrio sp. JC009]|uniref:hypothetical protein n=1 Tax=Vibrio sp. JC009 TaxID=2912314 RepID=UPI0023B1F0E9|nr:hypothetical protein [Vibrio sp. JC009]WED23061.1 hypothetical protein L3Q72_06620 [Vibrio sp. JC009]
MSELSKEHKSKIAMDLANWVEREKPNHEMFIFVNELAFENHFIRPVTQTLGEMIEDAVISGNREKAMAINDVLKQLREKGLAN